MREMGEALRAEVKTSCVEGTGRASEASRKAMGTEAVIAPPKRSRVEKEEEWSCVMAGGIVVELVGGRRCELRGWRGCLLWCWGGSAMTLVGLLLRGEVVCACAPPKA